MNVTENEFNAALFGHLTSAQRQRLDALDAAFADLFAQPRMDPAEVEALAEGVVSLYDEVTDAHPERETGPGGPVSQK
ncbi:hypothetical protein [Sinorhizobium meliloti]|uniref:hypothetical protein n=1 Tax=Rhizobium meliloti TaxID=382 RepID=UPI000FD7E02D|nr:hypothetical protein [Sinorhizobium meliloti]RVO61805.1 hypothetical protein CN092_01860 [Sinorhizobium meliloti]